MTALVCKLPVAWILFSRTAVPSGVATWEHTICTGNALFLEVFPSWTEQWQSDVLNVTAIQFVWCISSAASKCSLVWIISLRKKKNQWKIHVPLVLLPQMSENYQKNMRCFAKQAKPLKLCLCLPSVNTSFVAPNCTSTLPAYSDRKARELFKRKMYLQNGL